MESAAPTPGRLTPRQLEVLELMAKGLTNREIADVLGIASGTVKIHVSAVIEALEVTNRTEAAMALQDFLADGDAPGAVPGFGARPAIAVLPFDSMSPGEGQAYFCDGLVEDLTTRLAAWRWFPVISRTSAFVFKGQRVDAVQIGRDLGARYLVEGSVRRTGNRVRVNVQLIDAPTGEHVHAQQFDRELDDVFAVQDEIAEAVLGVLCPALLRFEALRVERRPAARLGAWDGAMRGFSHLARQEPEDIARAALLFDEVIAREPTFALGHSARAAAAVLQGFLRLGASQSPDASPGDAQQALTEGLAAFAEAERFGRNAIGLDPLDPGGHAAVGWGLLLQGRHEESRPAVERALELDPSSAVACFAGGMLALAQERPDEAVELLERAARISPHDPFLFHFLGLLGAAHLLRGDFGAAERALRRSVDAQPASSMSYRPARVVALALLGRLEEARQLYDEVLAISPGFSLGPSRLVAPTSLMRIVDEGFALLGIDPG
jgi:adenylate cyclase